MPISTSASLGSECALDGGRVSIGTRDSSVATGDGGMYDGSSAKRSARERGAGAASIHSASVRVDIVVVRIVMGTWVVMFQIALGYLL